MARLAITRESDVESGADYFETVDAEKLRWAKRMTPAEFPLQLYIAEFEAGATLRWRSEHDDEALYVLDGSLSVSSAECAPGGAVIIEAGIDAEATTARGVTVAHFGRSPRAEAASTQRGRCVHVVDPAGWFESGTSDNVTAIWFADATCPTCDAALFRVDKAAGAGPGPNHSHSVDELVYVLSGAVFLGSRELDPGTCLCIAADQRYTVGPGDKGYSFLNYRPTASRQRNFPRDGSPFEEPEGGLARGGHLVGAVQHVAAG